MHWLDALYLKLPRARLFEAGWGECEPAIDAARHDGIVPPSAMERVAAHWGVAPRWLDSGHLGALLFHRASMRQAVLDALR